MTDFEETRRRRKSRRQIKEPPTHKSIFYTCECGNFCTVVVPIKWTGGHTCSKCGAEMKEV